MDGFVHLHVHSHYSLLDGAGTCERLVNAAKSRGMTSLALTDHGNLFGAMDFYNTAKAAGIKPILGIEAYISPTTRTDKSMGSQREACYHLILLAMNATGWLNLKRLSSRAFLEGFYYRPRVDRELLSQLSEGIICTSACLGGEIPNALMNGNYEKALHIAGEYADIFGKDRFFVEIQNGGIDEQAQVNPDLLKIARDIGVGTVGTNDVHFVSREDKPSHEVLCCVSTGKTLDEERQAIESGKKKAAYTEDLYLKSPEEMRSTLREFQEACDNTLKIAEMCDLDIDLSKAYLPVFPVPQGSTDDDHLADLAWEGLSERFGGREKIPADYSQRMDWELQVIRDKGYSSYFLICHDFVNYARSKNIPASPRGSGLSSLLCYSLRIAEIDPLRYGLLFERFTDPQRKEAPDLDIDICQEGRQDIIRYVREKYGHVAQIITYGTLKAKAVLKDVGRTMGFTPQEMDVITKLVPDGPKVTLEKALATEPDLKKLYDSDARIKELIEYGKRLEGLCRHTGVHAAGVIIADVPLEDVVPLYCQGGNKEEVITQWDGPTSEKAGLMKMDFLGLRTLTIIQRARELVRAKTGKDIDPETLPLDDPKVYELFCRGYTDGVFQFESDGMKNVLRQMQPSKITDLIAANAMYRPGPMELIPTYCHRKNGTEGVPEVHPLVDDILAETYGIMTYQEQVMMVLNRLGKLPLNRALTLIKAISKKKEKTIADEKPNFITGCKENGIDAGYAEELFSLILKFAGYGFNKSHSTRYAIVAYQTAFFKVHYPHEFLAATLTFECGDTDKVVQYMAEARRMGVKVLPPDINSCGVDFAVDGNAVRFGLSAVKGVGPTAVEEIVRARKEVNGKFRDLYHFCEFVDLRVVNRGAMESLIKCGAFDALGATRSAMIAAVDGAISFGNKSAADRKSGQMSFFGTGGLLSGKTEERPAFPNVEPWSKTQLLKAEKETLGFYVSDHPLVEYGRELSGLSYPPQIALGAIELDVNTYKHDLRLRIGCMIQDVRTVLTKKDNRKMAMLTLEDTSGKLDAVVFPNTYEQLSGLIVKDELVFIIGQLDRTRERPQIIVEEIHPMDVAVRDFTAGMLLTLPDNTGKTGETLREILIKHKGNCAVQVNVRPACRNDVYVTIDVSREFFVQPDRKLMKDLEDFLIDQNYIRLAPRPVPPGRQRKGFQRKTSQGQAGPASEAVTRFN